ncbi:MAG: CAP domain-containing protein [Beijerinckiaceae bacterium]|jgi:uncharacterized protein YkwD|nr:CAP domain-containing protein [Beijerinckiaceae bacterium]
MRLRLFWSVAIAAMLGGCVSADPTGSTRPAPASRPVASAAINAGQALASLNAYRRAHGLSPVRLDAAVTGAARAQSLAMARQGLMSHEAGGDFRARLLAHGVGRVPAVENIAWGQRSFAEAMQSWQASHGHAQNMQAPDMTRLGVAVVDTPSGAYWTLVLAGDARR